MKKLFTESLLATILVFIVLWLLFTTINISFKPFNYVVKSIKKINLNDLYFSSIENNSIDTNIIIINIEDLDRKGIADVLSKVQEAKPAVIGLDVFFSNQLITPDDSLLKSTIHDLGDKVVMVSAYNNDGDIDKDYWSLNNTNYGHSGLLTNEDRTEVVREFEPKINSNEEYINSFSSEIAKRYSAKAYQSLEHRNHKKETIHYIGGEHAFRIINYMDLLTSSEKDLRALKNKIVLVGFCGGYLNNTADLDDIFYTPVGFNMSANRLPDMYGILVHANIISMIINGKYINHSPGWIVILITVVLTFLHVIAFTFFYVKKHLYYHIAAKLIQLVSFILILWLVFLAFSHFHYYIPTKYILVSVILSVDVLYLYEALAVLLYKKAKIKSIFVHDH